MMDTSCFSSLVISTFACAKGIYVNLLPKGGGGGRGKHFI